MFQIIKLELLQRRAPALNAREERENKGISKQ